MADERWRPIPGFPDYEVSDKGRVRSWRGIGRVPKRPERPTLLLAHLRGTSFYVRLRKNGAQRRVAVRRLMMKAWGFDAANVTLTGRQARGLREVCWGHKHFGAAMTGKFLPRDVVAALVKKGLVESAGLCMACDGDGHILQPPRGREGWRPTDAGLRTMRRIFEQQEES